MFIYELVVADYDQKAEDAVDYEDIQEQYEGPEVQIAPQDMKFYADAALAGPTNIVDEDNYDEDDYLYEQRIEAKVEDEGFNSEDPAEAKAEDDDFDSEQPAETKAEDEDFDSEQPREISLQSLVKNPLGMLLH